LKTLKSPKANRAIEAKKQNKQQKLLSKQTKLKLIDSIRDNSTKICQIEKAKIEPSLISIRQRVREATSKQEE